ncbi:MAG: DUF4340 domain-containing protein [Bacteroidales bacterium]|nr:DUF4340 domain-containing protein [Bacteroidales bacterium]
MFKKLSSGILIIFLIILMAIYLIVRFSGPKDRTFRDKAVSFDPASITQMLIDNPGQDEVIDLQFTGSRWELHSKGKVYEADSNVIKTIISQLSDLPTKQYAGRGPDAWEKHEVTDETAPLVTMKSGDKTVASIYIGKFTFTMPKEQQQQFRQQQGDMTSYVRLGGEDEVYAVDGVLRINFNREADEYRNKTLSNLNPDDITRMIFEKMGTSITLELVEGNWLLDGMPADSASVVSYRSTLARLSGNKFVEENILQGPPDQSLRLEGNNFSPVTISAYPVADTNIHYVITSSQNPGAYFNGKETDLYNRTFKQPHELLPNPQ